MNDMYIQNMGKTKTFIHEQGRNSLSEVDWNANYDGNIANIELGVSDNLGQTVKYQFHLDNEDLEEMLSIPSVNQHLDKRLRNDFSKKKKEPPLFIIVEEPQTKIKIVESLRKRSQHHHSSKPKTIKKYTHISSPRFSEKFIVPKKTIKRRRQTKKGRITFPEGVPILI